MRSVHSVVRDYAEKWGSAERPAIRELAQTGIIEGEAIKREAQDILVSMIGATNEDILEVVFIVSYAGLFRDQINDPDWLRLT